MVLTTVRLQEIQRAWKNDAMAVFGESKAGRRDARWTTDFIANTEANGISPCRELRAVEQRALPMKAFKVHVVAKEQAREYAPKEYHEAWLVEACGKVREWRVFDDPSDPENPHTVLLWSAG